MTSKPSVNCSRGCNRCRLRNRRSGFWTRQLTSAVSALIATWRKRHARSQKLRRRRSIGELAEVTGGAVTGVNQVARLQAWLQQNGCAVEDLQKKTVETLLEDAELPPKVRRALELRQDGGQSAVKKIGTLLQRAGDDDRVRGSLQFHKASTGRWAGEGFQPQNLKRPEVEDLEAAIAAVKTGDYEHVRGLYPRALSLLGDLGRSLIVAAPGHTLIGADFSAIESRVLAWVAGEQWKLDAHRRFDATQDPRDEPYSRSGLPDVARAGRHLHPGIARAKNREILRISPAATWGAPVRSRELRREYSTKPSASRSRMNGVPRIRTSRTSGTTIDRAAWAAVQNRGSIVRCGPVAFRCVGTSLQLKLPSGRKLAYPIARTKLIDPQRGVVLFTDNSAGRWRDCRDGRGAYGGVWTENIVQAISRDLLADAMLRVEAAGYPIVLHVHDEIVCEVPEGFGSTEEFTRIMTRAPSWALTLPIAAKAWAGAAVQLKEEHTVDISG